MKSIVVVTNVGTETATGITVKIPLLQNDSIYSQATLRSGKGETYIEDIPAGATVSVIVEYDIMLTKPTATDKLSRDYRIAYSYYHRHKGSGNCRDLTRAYIADLHNVGMEAREVIGWARPKRGDMTAGDLRGSRHSWAEVKINGRWLPVDLTFGYFGEFPHKSHIVDGYEDRSVKVNYKGGRLIASWINEVN